MRKLSVLPLSIIIVFIMGALNNAYAEEFKLSEEYNIHMELFSETKEAEIFNNNKDTILTYFNKEVKKWRQATSTDNLSYLSKTDIDFSDDDKISCIKINDTITAFDYDLEYSELSQKIYHSDSSLWYFYIEKDNTCYHGYIYSPEHERNTSDFSNRLTVDGWQIDLEIVRISDGISNTSDTKSVIENNLLKLLKDVKETSKDVYFVRTYLKYPNTDCGIVFVNGKAKYIYYYAMPIPYEIMRDDTPKYVRDTIVSYAEKIGYNTNPSNNSVIRLYSYRSIISMFRTCERYSDEYVSQT